MRQSTACRQQSDKEKKTGTSEGKKAGQEEVNELWKELGLEIENEKVCIQGGRLALGPFRLSKLGMASLWVPFSVGMGPFGRSG